MGSTLFKYRKFLKDAPPELLKEFVEYGRTPAGIFPRFIEAVKPRKKRSKVQLSEVSEGNEGNEDSDLEEAKTDSGSDELQSESDDDEIDEDKARRYKLCPFCDGPMPPVPSKALIDMLIKLHAKTRKDPYPFNKKGRIATSFVVHSEFCERHRYEAIEIPKATAAGWTGKADFTKLEQRIEAWKEDLDLMLEDIEASRFFERACKASTDKTVGAPQGYSTFTEQGAG